MKTLNRPVWFFATLSLALCGPALFVNAEAAIADPQVPAVIEKGFGVLKAAGAEAAFDAWGDAALRETDKAKRESGAKRFAEMVKPLRDYRSHEVVEVKQIGKMSKILYLAIRFERGMVYAKFLVWRSDQDWIVQQLNFDTRPEVIMPWLASKEPG